MDSNQQNLQNTYNQIAVLLHTQNKSESEIKNILIEQGVDEKDARNYIDEVANKLDEAKKSAARKDIIWGSVWCFGGLIGTFANTGFIFWGAIIFGGIQLVKGLINYNSI